MFLSLEKKIPGFATFALYSFPYFIAGHFSRKLEFPASALFCPLLKYRAIRYILLVLNVLLLNISPHFLCKTCIYITLQFMGAPVMGRNSFNFIQINMFSCNKYR